MSALQGKTAVARCTLHAPALRRWPSRFLNPDLRQAFEKEVPLERIAQPEDIANAAVWLSAPAFVTGLDLQVNGGDFLYRFPTPAELPGGVAAFEKRPLPPLA